MDELIIAIDNLNDEEMLNFLLTVYWTIMFPIIFLILQVNNWYPFKKSFRARHEYKWGWFALIVIIPFHIIAFIGGMIAVNMVTHLIRIIVTSPF